MQPKLFTRLFKDSVHGGVLKVVALLARIIFLLVVIPNLLQGELASYVFINSMAVIVATVGMLGLNEDLPRVVAGDVEKTRPFLFWFPVAQCLLMVAIGLLLYRPSTISACAVFAIALLSGRYLAGLVRSIDVLVAERQSNLPWVLFLIVTLALGLTTASDLVLTMAIALSAVQWYVYLFIRLRLSLGTTTTHIALMDLVRHGIRHGLARMLSTICLMGAVRGFVLWPVWLNLPYDIDQIAFAITASTIVTQFGLVPVHRAYARWCRTNDFSRGRVWQAVYEGLAIFLVLLSLATVAVYLADYFGFMPPQIKGIEILLQAVAVAALLPTFYLLRYLLISRNIMLGWLVAVALALFVAAGFVTLMFPIEYWFAIFWVFLAVACAIIAIKSFAMVPR